MPFPAFVPFAVAALFSSRPDRARTVDWLAIADTARQVVAVAHRAVEVDSVAPLRARWEARLRRDPADRAARLGLATIARRTFEYDRADREYAEVLKQSATTDAIALQARLGAAHVEQDHRSFARAATIFRQALVDARATGDTAAQVEGVVGIANWAALAAGPRVARVLLDSVTSLLAAVPADLAGEYHCVRGLQVFFEGGAGAVAEERQGLQLGRQAASRWVEGVCLTYLGGGRMTLGDIAGALALFDSADAVQRTAHDRWNLAATFVWRSFLDIQLYNHGAALHDVTLALAQADSAGAPAIRAWALRGLAHIEWHTSDLASASVHLAQSATLMKQIGDDRGYMALRPILGGVALDRGRVDEAEQFFRESFAWNDAAGVVPFAFADRQALAQVAMRREDWVAAAREMRELAAYGTRHALSGWVPGLEYDFGLIALHQHDYESAEQHFNRYLASSGKDQHLDRYSARSRRAELYLARGDAVRAAAELTAATDELDAVRASLDERGLRIMIFQTHRGYDDPDAGFATVVAGLVHAGQVGVALELVERRRARQLADELALARSLRTGVEPASPNPDRMTAGKRFGMDWVRAAIPDDRTVLIEFVTGSKSQSTTVFTISRSAEHAFVLVPIDSLRTDIEQLTESIRSGHDVSAVAATLRAALLDSVLSTLPATTKRLIVVPDEALHTLPFDALALSDGRPVVGQFAIAEVPSLAIAVDLWRRPANAGPARVLALGDPAFGGGGNQPAIGYQDAFAATGGLPRLAGSAREAKLAAAFSPDGEVRLQRDASEAWVRHADLRPFRVIHFATHALVDERSAMRTALALTPGGGEDGFLGPGEIAALQLRADLVVLSACRTAGGVIVGGEGVQGLTGPLLEAGAGAVLATLWPVGDESTVKFVDAYYRGIARGLDLLDALQAAKLETVARGAPAAQWAGFVLVGNPSLHIPLREPAASPPWWIGVLALGLIGAVAARRIRAR